MLATYSDFRVNSVFIRLSMRPAIKAHSVRIMGNIPPRCPRFAPMPSQCPAGQLDRYCTYALSQFSISTVRTYVSSIFFCVEIISSTLPLRKQRNTLRFGTIRLKWKTASGFPLRPYRTETYW